MNQRKIMVFLLEVISSQINKYYDLVRIGIGPDAKVNAYIVSTEVSILLEMTEQLLQGNMSTTLIYESLMKVKFFRQQEYRRARAGWLIDENKIHNTVHERTQNQLLQLSKLAEALKLPISHDVHPSTEFERQCMHDSFAIAFKILKLAVELRKNPDNTEIIKTVPAHAVSIIKKHAQKGGRYYNETVWSEINDNFSACEYLLSQSKLNTTTKTLSKQEAISLVQGHVEQFQNLVSQFNLNHPATLSIDLTQFALPRPPSPRAFSWKTCLISGGVALFASSVAAISFYSTLNTDDLNHKIINP